MVSELRIIAISIVAILFIPPIVFDYSWRREVDCFKTDVTDVVYDNYLGKYSFNVSYEILIEPRIVDDLVDCNNTAQIFEYNNENKANKNRQKWEDKNVYECYYNRYYEGECRAKLTPTTHVFADWLFGLIVMSILGVVFHYWIIKKIILNVLRSDERGDNNEKTNDVEMTSR